MNSKTKLFVSALLLLAMACTNEDERGGKAPDASGGENRQEVLLTLKNKLAIAPTKAGTKAPIATAEENALAALDVYVFGSDTEGGTYTYLDRFAYRADGSALPAGATAIDLSVSATDTEAKGLLSLKKGLYVKLYAIANQTGLVDPADETVTVPDAFFKPLVMTERDKAMAVLTAGVPAEAAFLTFHTPRLVATQPTDVLNTPLAMAGAYTTALDLTDFASSARPQVSFKLTRLTSRFDISNDAAKSKFTIQSVSMAAARRGTGFFPIQVLGASPAAADDVVTLPARAFTGDKANIGLQPGAFYSYPSPTADGGYLILKGTYAVNQSESKEVSYSIPFKPANDAEGATLEIAHNHRYTIAITAADLYHLDFTLTVADWADDGSIDEYTPGGGATGGAIATVDISADPNGKTLYDAATHTVTMPLAAATKFDITASTGYTLATTYAGGPAAQSHDWLDVAQTPITKADADSIKYTFSVKSGYTGGEYPEVAIRFTHPSGGESQAFRVTPKDFVEVDADLSGTDVVKETDDNSYRVANTANKTVSVVAYSMFKAPVFSITTAYAEGFGEGNHWLPAPKVKTELAGNRYKHTYDIAIPASAGLDADYQLHKGTIAVKNGSSTIKTYTLWRGASNKPYPTGDTATPYYTALKKGAYWWAPVNCGAKHVAKNGVADTDGIGNQYQWGRKDATNHGGAAAVAGPIAAYTDAAADKFYKNDSSPYDWLSPKNDNLWQNGLNDPCPEGYRVPTSSELAAWGTTNAGTWGGQLLTITCETGYPPMVLPAAGNRYGNDGSSNNRGAYGLYWSSTPSSTTAVYIDFNSTSVLADTSNRAYGLSVRCVRK